MINNFKGIGQATEPETLYDEEGDLIAYWEEGLTDKRQFAIACNLTHCHLYDNGYVDVKEVVHTTVEYTEAPDGELAVELGVGTIPATVVYRG